MPDSSALALIPRGSLGAEMVKNNGDLKNYSHTEEMKIKFSVCREIPYCKCYLPA